MKNNQNLFPIICSRCNKEGLIPYKGEKGKPVYCMQCYNEIIWSDTELGLTKKQIEEMNKLRKHWLNENKTINADNGYYYNCDTCGKNILLPKKLSIFQRLLGYSYRCFDCIEKVKKEENKDNTSNSSNWISQIGWIILIIFLFQSCTRTITNDANTNNDISDLRYEVSALQREMRTLQTQIKELDDDVNGYSYDSLKT